MEDKRLTKQEDTARRDYYIDMVCEETGLDRDDVAAEMDYAKENGIKYKVYALKGYWNIPHEILIEAHNKGKRRRRIAREIAEQRGRDRHSVEKEMIYAKYKLGLRIGYFRKYDWDLLTEEEKGRMLLRPYSAQMSNKYRTEDADSDLLNNKERFYEAFPDLIGRRWMHYDPDMSREAFAEAIALFETTDVIYKPDISSGGIGIRKFSFTHPGGYKETV